MIRIAFAFAIAASCLAFACSGSTVDTASAADSGAADSSTSTDLVPTGSTKAVISITGGFEGPGASDGSTCTPANDTYTVDLSAKSVEWKLCRLNGQAYAFVTGNKTLSDADFGSLTGKMHGLTRATKTSCGADAPEQTITFSSPTGDTTLYDDFYFCNASDPKIYVTNLDDVISALSDLAQ